ncbi:MAG: hypothetical protein RBT37_06230 [Dissulfurispiraceae bacterium]|jgi:hypothetical protein|nr:hypothetical protein [Dissulfurispiraceae bacterium]
MKKSELNGMLLSDLRSMAKKAGISAERTWKKEDFVKMLLKADKAGKKSEKKHQKKNAEKKSITNKNLKKSTAINKPVQNKLHKKSAAAKPAKKADIKDPAQKSAAKEMPQKTSTAPTKAKKGEGKEPKKKNSFAKSSADIKTLTVAELKLMAKKCSVKLIKNLKKADIIKAITKAKTAKSAPVADKTADSKTENGIDLDEYRPSLYKKLLTESALKPELSDELICEDQNSITAMMASQNQLFVFWNIVENALRSLNLKVVDTATGSFFYVPVWGMTAEQIVGVRPGCIYSVEIGTISGTGRFRRIATAKAPKTAAEHVKIKTLKERVKLPARFFRTPLPKGSY